MAHHEPTNLPPTATDTEHSSVDGLDEDELKLVITREERDTRAQLCRNGHPR